MAKRAVPPAWLGERVRTNLRILKAHRGMNNLALAEAGGFTTRQLVDNRENGRTDINMDDLARLAAALRVEPHVLLLRTDEALRWVEDNPDFRPERLTKQSPNALKSDIMRERRKMRRS